MLDNKQLSESIIDHLKMLPNSTSTLRDLPRESKVEIYDNNCGGCGFCRVEVHTLKGVHIFNNVKDAIDIAESGGYRGISDIKRTCSYPGNVEIVNGEEYYPTLTEIIMNTCRLWSDRKCEMNDNIIEEVVIEASIEVSHRQIPQYRHDGEVLHIEIVPE